MGSALNLMLLLKLISTSASRGICPVGLAVLLSVIRFELFSATGLVRISCLRSFRGH